MLVYLFGGPEPGLELAISAKLPGKKSKLLLTGYLGGQLRCSEEVTVTSSDETADGGDRKRGHATLLERRRSLRTEGMDGRTKATSSLSPLQHCVRRHGLIDEHGKVEGSSAHSLVRLHYM